MKKTTIIISGVGLILALSAIFLLGFNEQPPTRPSDSILEFHEKALDGDIQGTKKYVANDILKAFENGAYPHYGSYGGFITDYKNKTAEVFPQIDTEEIRGETAQVEVKIKYHNDREATETYYLIKEDGKWKIAE